MNLSNNQFLIDHLNLALSCKELSWQNEPNFIQQLSSLEDRARRCKKQVVFV